MQRRFSSVLILAAAGVSIATRLVHRHRVVLLERRENQGFGSFPFIDLRSGGNINGGCICQIAESKYVR